MAAAHAICGRCGWPRAHANNGWVLVRGFFPPDEAARLTGLPLVIHTREAWADTFAIMREERVAVAAASRSPPSN